MAVSVADSANPYNMMPVGDRVVEETAKGANERIDKMAKKYLRVDKYLCFTGREKSGYS